MYQGGKKKNIYLSTKRLQIKGIHVMNSITNLEDYNIINHLLLCRSAFESMYIRHDQKDRNSYYLDDKSKFCFLNKCNPTISSSLG